MGVQLRELRGVEYQLPDLLQDAVNARQIRQAGGRSGCEKAAAQSNLYQSQRWVRHVE